MKKLVREYINEKFKEESDPIRDMGIGVYVKRDFNNIRKLYDYISEILPIILRTEEIPKDIIDSPESEGWYIKEEYYNIIYKFVKKYITLNGNNDFIFDAERFHKFLHEKYYPKLRSWMYEGGGRYPGKYGNKKSEDERPVLPDYMKESINEKFSEDSDPIDDMNIGLRHQIKKDMDAAGIHPDNYEIEDDGFIKTTKTSWSSGRWIPEMIKVQMKYLSEEERNFVKRLKKIADNYLEDAVEKALKDGISKDKIIRLVDEFGSDIDNRRITMLISKLSRTPEQIKQDEENNVYVFIGYTEKHPVKINGKKYYEDRFQTEKMIKIDKYNYGDLSQISMMDLRAKAQYGHDGAVYMINIPKELMDEKYYNEIPEEYRYIIEKYKKRIK